MVPERASQSLSWNSQQYWGISDTRVWFGSVPVTPVPTHHQRVCTNTDGRCTIGDALRWAKWPIVIEGAPPDPLRYPLRRPLRRPKTPLWGAPEEGDQRVLGHNMGCTMGSAPYRAPKGHLKGRLKGHLKGRPWGALRGALRGGFRVP